MSMRLGKFIFPLKERKTWREKKTLLLFVFQNEASEGPEETTAGSGTLEDIMDDETWEFVSTKASVWTLYVIRAPLTYVFTMFQIYEALNNMPDVCEAAIDPRVFENLDVEELENLEYLEAVNALQKVRTEVQDLNLKCLATVNSKSFFFLSHSPSKRSSPRSPPQRMHRGHPHHRSVSIQAKESTQRQK